MTIDIDAIEKFVGAAGGGEVRMDADNFRALIAELRELRAEVATLRASLSYSEGMYERRLEDIAALRALNERTKGAPKRLADEIKDLTARGFVTSVSDVVEMLFDTSLDGAIFGEGGQE